MRIVIPALILPAICLGPLCAQTTGAIKGKIVDSKGNPVAGAKITLSKIGVTWVKELKTGKDGSYMQVGLDPKEYDITVSAPGFTDIKDREKISLGNVSAKNYTLLTPQETPKQGGAPVDTAENKGLESYNQAVALSNEKNFVGALPLFEGAVTNLNESIAKAKDDAAKAELDKKLATINRPYSFTLMEVAKADPTKADECATKAEPILKKAFEQNAKDQNVVLYLLEAAKIRKDDAGIKQYQAALDAILGPRPELAYNQGVELYNAGKLKEAKPCFLKAIEVDPKFADSYYLLAMCEFADMNLKGTKQNLQKYVELAPNGKNAAEAKAMLQDPSLKNVK